MVIYQECLLPLYLVHKKRRLWGRAERLPLRLGVSRGYYLDSPLCLHKPAAQHRLDLAVRQLVVGCLDLPLHRVFQEQAPQTPIKELTGGLPLQDILKNSVSMLFCELNSGYAANQTDYTGKVVKQTGPSAMWAESMCVCEHEGRDRGDTEWDEARLRRLLMWWTKLTKRLLWELKTSFTRQLQQKLDSHAAFMLYTRQRVRVSGVRAFSPW